MKTIHIDPLLENTLTSENETFLIPTFIQMYILQKFGAKNLPKFIYNRCTNLGGNFIWEKQHEGSKFWEAILGYFPLAININNKFYIPEFENSKCILHKVYLKILKSNSQGIYENHSLVFNKLLKKFGEDLKLERFCIINNTSTPERVFKCPCCGELI